MVKKLQKIGWMVKYHLIALRGELELEFVKNAKEKGKFGHHPLNFFSTLKP